MVLGIAVSGTVMLLGGATMVLLVSFQVLVGLRVIKLGKLHRKVHKWTAYVIIAGAAVHAVLALAFVTGWSIL